MAVITRVQSNNRTCMSRIKIPRSVLSNEIVDEVTECKVKREEGVILTVEWRHFSRYVS